VGCFEVVVDVEGYATTTSCVLEAGFFSGVLSGVIDSVRNRNNAKRLF